MGCTIWVCVSTLTFAQRRNRLTTHFPERIPVVKRRMTVYRHLLEQLNLLKDQNSIRGNKRELSGAHPASLQMGTGVNVAEP